MRCLRLALLPLVLVSCTERQPASPEIDVGPELRATFGDIFFEGFDDFTDFVQCANDGAGESLRWYGPFRVTGTTVTSNSGNVQQRWDLEYLDGYAATGLTTGDVWTIVEGRLNAVALSNTQNGTWVRNTVYLETYENQDGARMFVQTTVHVTFANDVWRVLRAAVTACNPR